MPKYENISMYSYAPVFCDALRFLKQTYFGGQEEGNLKHLVYDIQISLTK